MIFLNGQILLKTHQSGHTLGGNDGLTTFYLKCFWAWLKIFHFTFQTTWVVFPSGHSKHCAQGEPPYKVGR
jgi:hypothetical protein